MSSIISSVDLSVLFVECRLSEDSLDRWDDAEPELLWKLQIALFRLGGDWKIDFF